MKNACFGCDERHVWYDDEGKAHTCHETCERHAKYKKRIEEANKRKREEAEAKDLTSRSVIRLLGRYKWNKG